MDRNVEVSLSLRRVSRPRLEVERPDQKLARKIESAFPEPSNEFLGKPNVQPYWCEECGRSFLCESSVQRHLWYHLRRKVGLWEEPTPPGKKFQCSECGWQFRLHESWAEHVTTHQEFPCNCKLWYPSKPCLERHALLSHSKRRLHNFLRAERNKEFWEQG